MNIQRSVDKFFRDVEYVRPDGISRKLGTIFIVFVIAGIGFNALAWVNSFFSIVNVCKLIDGASSSINPALLKNIGGKYCDFFVCLYWHAVVLFLVYIIFVSSLFRVGLQVSMTAAIKTALFFGIWGLPLLTMTYGWTEIAANEFNSTVALRNFVVASFLVPLIPAAVCVGTILRSKESF